jgi:hypothetical protein
LDASSRRKLDRNGEDLVRISAHLRGIIELLIDMHTLKKLPAEAT